MRRHYFQIVLAAYLVFFAQKTALAQMSKDDSAFYQTAIANAIETYHQSAGDQSGLYNGSVYPGYAFKFKKGSPFFESEKFNDGSIFYDGIFYATAPLQYDNLKELVLVEDNSYRVQLFTSRVSEFTLLGHHFIRPEKSDLNAGILNTIFYEVLHEGSIGILKKEAKTILEELSITEGIERSIIITYQYYIEKNNKYYSIGKQKDMLTVLGDKKKEIQQFLKKNKLKFRKDNENTLLRVATYYEQLTKKI